MKIGTLRCRLFGHKLVVNCSKYDRYDREDFDIKRTWKEVTNWCTRCGIKREELLN